MGSNMTVAGEDLHYGEASYRGKLGRCPCGHYGQLFNGRCKGCDQAAERKAQELERAFPVDFVVTKSPKPKRPRRYSPEAREKRNAWKRQQYAAETDEEREKRLARRQACADRRKEPHSPRLVKCANPECTNMFDQTAPNLKFCRPCGIARRKASRRLATQECRARQKAQNETL